LFTVSERTGRRDEHAKGQAARERRGHGARARRLRGPVRRHRQRGVSAFRARAESRKEEAHSSGPSWSYRLDTTPGVPAARRQGSRPNAGLSLQRLVRRGQRCSRSCGTRASEWTSLHEGPRYLQLSPYACLKRFEWYDRLGHSAIIERELQTFIRADPLVRRASTPGWITQVNTRASRTPLPSST